MGKVIRKAIWLSFDLGVAGDYPGLYKWLDEHDAVECGDSVAFFFYSIDREKENDIIEKVKADLKDSVVFRPGDRLYVVYRERTVSGCKVRGDFMLGKRKASPWEGYGDQTNSGGEFGE